jgi:LacI family gluconate utilization system Gnt-I transcriptional repressor
VISSSVSANDLADEKPGVKHPGSRQPQRRRSTLADVARHAGVTTMTVSRFLRTPAQVSPMTAQRVQEALERTGYVANKQAGILATGASSMVAAIIPNIAHSIFSETILGLSDTLEAQGFELLLASSGYSLEREQKQIRALLGWNPFALVVTGRHHTPGSIRLLLAAQDAGTPVVEMWDQTGSRPEFAHIGFDHAAAGALMARHLMAQGYCRLVYVDSGVDEDFRAHERGVGFVQAAAAQHGIEARVVRAGIGEPIAAGRAVLQKLMGAGSSTSSSSKKKPYQHQPPRALAFANDHLAVGAWLQAQDLRIAVPERIALLGFGDFPIAGQISGGISTVAAPRYAIGQAVGQWIARQKKAAPLVERVSTSFAASDDPKALPPLEPVLVQRRST